MSKNLELEYLSDQVQNCFCELFNEAYVKTQNFSDALCQVSIYLINDKNTYDYILKKYNISTKDILVRMFISNFLEITYYRKKNNIPIDKERLGLLSIIEDSTFLENNSILDLVKIDIKQFVIMINDVLLYFWHLSPIYSYNAVRCIINDGVSKKLYDIYPLALNEHLLTLEDTYSKKEYLLFTFYEVLINATERIIFSSGGFPVHSLGYIQELKNILKAYNGHNPNLPNIHKGILNEFQFRTGIINNTEDKILLMEIIISLIKLKQKNRFPPLEADEKAILNTFDYSESISDFYDKNNQDIISILINNFGYFSNEELLQDISGLNNIYKKRK